MMTQFWKPGIRCLVQRTARHTVVDLTFAECAVSDCRVSVVWQPLNSIGLANSPPLTLGQETVRLMRIASERTLEGRVILPAIRDDVWEHCYLILDETCDSIRASQNPPD